VGKSRQGRQPGSKRPAPNAISIRGTPEWRAWVGRLAERYRARPATLIDMLLTERAERDGFEKPPPRL
jgi:hypothetical protein